MVEASDGRGSKEKVEAKEGKGEVRQERKVDGEAATLVAVEGVGATGWRGTGGEAGHGELRPAGEEVEARGGSGGAGLCSSLAARGERDKGAALLSLRWRIEGGVDRAGLSLAMCACDGDRDEELLS